MTNTSHDGVAAPASSPDEARPASRIEATAAGRAGAIESYHTPSGHQPSRAARTDDVPVTQGWFDKLRLRASPWVAAAADTIVPLSVGVAAVLVFGLLEQARDALFGALGGELRVEGKQPRFEGGSLFWYWVAAAIVFGNLLWYTGRVMATTSIRDAVSASHYARARTHYPRLLAYLLTSLLVVMAVSVARDHVDSGGAALAWACLGLLVPVVLVPFMQHRSGGSRRWAVLAIALTAVAQVVLMKFRPPEGEAWQTMCALAFASTVPTMCYVLWVRRRSWLNTRGSADALLASYGWRLWGFVAGFVLIFGALALAPAWIPRALGSPAIALIVFSGLLVGLVAVCLVLRAVERRLPGLVAVGALAALSAAVLVRVAYKVEPWREVPGTEKMKGAAVNAPPLPPAALPDQHDIVVNAYGGGLRAAFYTAALLARMDDISCGAFGARLTALSGVSGGSLGIATFLVARQRVVAAGGWKNCDGKRAVVGALVEDVLRRDHLSAVVARMLTVDLLPYITPRRGQALLDSWDEAIRAESPPYPELGLADGLAMPLTGLTGGIHPVPLVLFNATDAASGGIVWMSNRGRWGRENDVDDKSGQRDRPTDIQLGQAVLHSARFPVVSPVGSLANKSGAPVRLVDGGLSDVSGATTLSEQVSAPAHWINIDGNFDKTPCSQEQSAGELKTWSTLNALLALRVKQATNAVEEMGKLRKPIVARLELAADTADPAKRCAAIAKLHMAPLGWYMSVRSADNMKQAIEAAATATCNRLGGLCVPRKPGT